MVKKNGSRILVDGDLVEFVAKARSLHMTYGQLQIQETLEIEREKKAAADRIARRKGGGTGGCKKVSSASKQVE